jgi:hypothetical protein
LTEPGQDVGLTPRDVGRQIHCGIEHARGQQGAPSDDGRGDAWEHPGDRLGAVDPSALAFPFGANDLGPYSAQWGRP